MKKDNHKKDKAASAENENNITDNEKNPLPVYPASEDIYSMDKEEDLDPEDLSAIKKKVKKPGKENEKDFSDDETGDDLDVPGAELDDEDEITGNEDEENNYYSIGGDNHEDLEEDRGD